MAVAALLALLTEVVRMCNLILEGTPVDQRRAQSIIWFWGAWPVVKVFLKPHVTPEVLERIEAGMKDAQ